MRRASLLVALVALLPTAAHAARWVLVSETATATRYIDLDAVVIDDQVATLWLKTEYATKQERGEVLAIEKWMHDCANRRAKLLALTRYKANGAVIGSAQLPRYELPWQNIAPDSAGEVIHRRVCGALKGTGGEREVESLSPDTV